MNLIAHNSTDRKIHSFIGYPSHGLLIVGQAGAGKGYVAKYIVSSLLKKEEADLENYPYLKILDNNQGESLGIDDIRGIKSFLKLKTTGDGKIRRFVIIKNADELGHEAQNAMLKLLEEPPSDSCIILTTAQPSKLKQTIISRLQTVHIKPLTKAYIQSNLAPDEDEAKRLFALSDGATSTLLSLVNNDDTESSNLKYMNKAKELISTTRFDRLAEIDKIVKDKGTDTQQLLDCMYRILNMKLQVVSRSSEDKKTIATMYAKMKLVLHAQRMLKQKVQEKLVLTRLFYEL